MTHTQIISQKLLGIHLWRMAGKDDAYIANPRCAAATSIQLLDRNNRVDIERSSLTNGSLIWFLHHKQDAVYFAYS